MQMNEDTRTLFKQTVQALIEIGLLYEQMYHLYRDEDCIRRLTAAEPKLFESIKRCFVDSIIIKLVQLCDTNPDSVSFCNLRRKIEAEILADKEAASLNASLKTHGANIWKNVEELEKVRNSRIGHLSQKALNNGLFKTSENRWIKNAMKEMDSFLVAVRIYFDKCDRSYIDRSSYSSLLEIDRFHEILEKGLA